MKNFKRYSALCMLMIGTSVFANWPHRVMDENFDFSKFYEKRQQERQDELKKLSKQQSDSAETNYKGNFDNDEYMHLKQQNQIYDKLQELGQKYKRSREEAALEQRREDQEYDNSNQDYNTSESDYSTSDNSLPETYNQQPTRSWRDVFSLKNLSRIYYQ